jgi:hypothetical protein
MRAFQRAAAGAAVLNRSRGAHDRSCDLGFPRPATLPRSGITNRSRKRAVALSRDAPPSSKVPRFGEIRRNPGEKERERERERERTGFSEQELPQEIPS